MYHAIVYMSMATHRLADVATTNQTIDNIQDWFEWSEMVECTQKTLEGLAE